MTSEVGLGELRQSSHLDQVEIVSGEPGELTEGSLAATISERSLLRLTVHEGLPRSASWWSIRVQYVHQPPLFVWQSP